MVMLFLSSIVDSSSLLNAGIMALPFELGIWRKCKNAFDSLPNLQYPAPVIPSPDAQDVFTISDTQNGTTNLVTSFSKLVSHDCKEKFLPVTISDTFLKSHNPLSALSVLLVLPYGSYSLFENMVVRHHWQIGRSLEVTVDGEELFHGIECCYRV